MTKPKQLTTEQILKAIDDISASIKETISEHQSEIDAMTDSADFILDKVKAMQETTDALIEKLRNPKDTDDDNSSD